MSNLKEKIKAAQIDLIKELGIDKLEPEQKEKIVMDIGEILQQRIVIRVVEELPDEKQDEFKEILDKGEENPELIDDFLKENVPGLEDMILEEIGEYKKGALGMIGQTTDQEETGVETEGKSEVVAETEIDKEQEKKEDQENSATENRETDLKIETETIEKQAEIKPETESEDEEEFKVNLNNTENLDLKEKKESEGSSNLDLDKRAEELGKENALKTEDEGSEEISKEESEEKTQDYREALNLKESPIEIKKSQEVEESVEDENSNLSQLEKEQFEDEAKILEENKVDNDVIQGEELDLSSELEKMEDGEIDDDKK